MNKVYCNNCKFFYLYSSSCTHPENEIIEDTPFKRKYDWPNYREANKNNDCKYWEKEPSLLSFILDLFKKN
jgi:hypothetical protein